MGRASKAEASKNRQLVLETACRLFRTHGTENVSVAQVMETSGLTHGAFAKQFGSRQALIDEAFELAFQQAAEAWTKVLTTSNEREAQQTMLRFYFQERPDRHNCPMLMFALSARETSDDSGAAAAYRDGVEDLYEQFPGADADPHKSVMFAAMIGAGLMRQAMGNTPWVEQLHATLIDAATDARRGPQTP